MEKGAEEDSSLTANGTPIYMDSALPEQHTHGPPAKPAEIEVPIVYEPFFDDLSTLEEQMELGQAMN